MNNVFLLYFFLLSHLNKELYNIYITINVQDKIKARKNVKVVLCALIIATRITVRAFKIPALLLIGWPKDDS